jgi:hypothetical protein
MIHPMLSRALARAPAALAVLAMAGCMGPPVRPPSALRMGATTLYVAPVAGASLSPEERARVRGEVAIALVAATDGAPGPAARARPRVVTSAAAADYVLRVDVDRVAEENRLMALLVGFGTGRPGYAAEARLERGGAAGEKVAARTRIAGERPAGTGRAAMLRDIAEAAARFARRHF